MKILIVEDDFTSRTMVYRLLKDAAECDTAVDGEEALHFFSTSIKDKTPYDLILLDIMLPNKDGQTVLKDIRDMESTAGIKGLERCSILMMTALDDSQNIIEAFRSQCEGYLPKPISKEKLIKAIHKLGIELKI
ncbi:response regulator [Spirochaeta cellobiosiphila]|uniref:response regulator n=1 Tax=Spirochaeta cellobiosiphila TaxID=504483 RepID=UPI000408D15D|nr:response regulator [Spirochaeta cellobiosiphila]